MKKTVVVILFILVSFCLVRAQTELRTERLQLIVSTKGQIIRMADPITGVDYLAKFIKVIAR